MSSSALTRPTLVLNKSWQPVRVATAARCLIMLWNGTVKAVDLNDYQTYSWEDWSRITPGDEHVVVRSVQQDILVPDVVVLQNYAKQPKRTVTFSRRNLFRRDAHQCQYCGCKPSSSELTIDHVLPRSQGGGSSWENCVLACVKCNTRKGGRTPEQANMPLKVKPVRPKWTHLFSMPKHRISTWSKFISDAYWDVELQE
ncbi:MAG: HNH endonuclease [Rubinisphaera brasiliensis]|uniref:HNH endonuclease n=1 Tax=Rubinisphaera brasiliensis (strain ATCC 49424 / DSM 5305 / JCM 21570 / IAM 15109 / NBRC 103401 / IFAM 1448) TaxID=756272 RepID=F0SQI4_RUBBR|nr:MULTISPECIES: HNH endonuclease [Rubinisphaera]ADY57959.1 HNH endonuclease [Rubinisphaera brasiliensis DSM 5305]MBR9802484.1 HNH endonuclease [bacterium]